MSELQTLESIIKNAPNDSWDTFNNERYYQRCGYRWSVWLRNTGVWSVPICNPPVDFINRKDIQKQIDQLKEIEGLRDQLDAWAEKYADLKIQSDANQWAHDNMQEQLASANEEIKSTKFLLGWKWE
jgi:hypothetical protein